MSHFNACFKLAKELINDHDVVFAGHSSFKEYIEAQGFIFYPLNTVPFGMGFERWVATQKKGSNTYLTELKLRLNDALYTEREKELAQLITDLKPDCILLDSYQATDFIIMYPELVKHRIRIALIQTMLPTAIRENVPPLNSLVLPDDPLAIYSALKNHKQRIARNRIKDKVVYLGMDDETIISRRVKKNHVPEKYISPVSQLRGIGLELVPEFILSPQEFDFSNNISTAQRYIGFNILPDRIEVSDIEYFKVDKEIRTRLSQQQGILIYCSFGSIQASDTSSVITFLDKLFQAVTDSNCILIVSINALHHKHTFPNVPDNVYVFKAAPQLEILARADVFITHGGLNSIKESIYMGVPMLVYPLHTITDTSGNSSRIVHHKLGLRGNMLTDTIEDIDNKIIELVNNDVYKTNIIALRDKNETYSGIFRKYYDALTPLG